MTPERMASERMSEELDVDDFQASIKNGVSVDEYRAAMMKAPLSEEDLKAIEEGIGSAPSGNSETFVDLPAPPRPPVPPPAKYKLCLVIWFTVYFVVWFAEGAGIVRKMIVDGGLRLNGALFFMFMIEIFVMVFCGVELVIGLTRIKIGDKWYGTLPWLMQPRCQWVKKYNNVFMEFLACIIEVAEDGFAIFNPLVIPPPPPKVKVFDLMDKNKEAVLKAMHHIDPEKVKEYDWWTKGMVQHMEMQPGFLAADLESVENNVYTWNLRFRNVEALNACMATPYWVRMVEGLQKLLQAPKVTQIMMEEPPINAFMDILTKQGESKPTLPPKKWKVWWMTTCSIFFSTLIVNSTAVPYYIKWGWTNWDPDLYRIVYIGSLVLVLNYMMSPAILLLVNQWMTRKPEENDTKFPWKQLNDGFSPPVQLILCLTYFVSTGVRWATFD